MREWDDTIDAAVAAAVGELRRAFVGSQVSIREVIDERGVVAVLITAGEGRLVLAARSVDLLAVEWPWPDGMESTVGVLPHEDVLTVDEVIGGLVAT